MKLKSIASLCKNRKMVYIYSGGDYQYIGLALFGGLILLPVLYEVALWLHRRRFARRLHQMAEAEKDAHHNRRAS